MSEATDKIITSNDEAMKLFDKMIPIFEKYDLEDVFISEEIKPWPRLDTGFILLNYILGGGLAKGAVTELFGPEGLGKSTLAGQLIASHQAEDPNNRALYMDFEQTMDIKRLHQLGVDVTRPRLIFTQPRSIEEGALLCKLMVERGIVNFVAWDTCAASQPAALVNAPLTDKDLREGMREADAGKSNMGAIGFHSRCFAAAIVSLLGVIKDADAILLLLNQTRTTINTWGAGETTPGGKAPKFYASSRIRLSKKDTIKESVDDVFLNKKESMPVELLIQFNAIKVKNAPPFKKCYIRCDVRPTGRGFLEVETIFDMAVKRKIIDKSGYYFTLPGVPEKIKGTDAAVAYLNDHPDAVAALKTEMKKIGPVTEKMQEEDLEEGDFDPEELESGEIEL